MGVTVRIIEVNSADADTDGMRVESRPHVVKYGMVFDTPNCLEPFSLKKPYLIGLWQSCLY